MATEKKGELAALEASARVKRLSGTGCLGTVKEVRSEVTATTGEMTDKGLMVVIDWDNGTTSYCTPGSIEVVT